jgi:hypothetical protein
MAAFWASGVVDESDGAVVRAEEREERGIRPESRRERAARVRWDRARERER